MSVRVVWEVVDSSDEALLQLLSLGDIGDKDSVNDTSDVLPAGKSRSTLGVRSSRLRRLRSDAVGDRLEAWLIEVHPVSEGPSGITERALLARLVAIVEGMDILMEIGGGDMPGMSLGLRDENAGLGKGSGCPWVS